MARRVYLNLGAASLFVATASLLRDQALASRFGLSNASDLFVTGFQVPMFVVSVFLSTLTASVLPSLIAARAASPGKFAHVYRHFHGRVVLLAVATAGLLSGLAQWYAPLLAPGFAHDKLENLSSIVAWLGAGTALGLISSYWTVALQSIRRFAMPAMTAAVVPIAIAVGVLVGPPSPWTAVAAALIGFALQALACAILVAREVRWQAEPGACAEGDHVALGEVWREAGLALVATLLMSLTPLLSTALASRTGPGGVAAFGMAYGLIAAAVGLSLKIVSGPIANAYATHAASGEFAVLTRLLKRHALGAFAFGCVGAALCWLAGGAVVRILYVHGRFGAEDARTVETLLVLLALQLPWHLSCALMTRAISALGANRVLLEASAINVAFFLAAATILSGPFGLSGIALAMSAMYLLSFAYCWWRLRGLLNERG